jgi:hypothetical protein
MELTTHKIHDLENKHVAGLLSDGLSKITDEKIIKNYHPDYANENSNLFFILKNGRYSEGKGAYYVIENSGEYVGSAGWNEYREDPTVAFALTRMYTSEQHRGNYFIANNILVKSLKETEQYEKVWLTMNEYNITLYKWFVRASQNKSTSIVNGWPEIYKLFKPLGQKKIYNTLQYVVELSR